VNTVKARPPVNLEDEQHVQQGQPNGFGTSQLPDRNVRASRSRKTTNNIDRPSSDSWDGNWAGSTLS
jgi:hypothetical protein